MMTVVRRDIALGSLIGRGALLGLLLLLLIAPAMGADDNYFNKIVPDTPSHAGLPACGDERVLGMAFSEVEQNAPQLRPVSIADGVQNNRAKFFAFETAVFMEGARFCQALLTYEVDKQMWLFYRVRWRDMKPDEAGVELYHALDLF